MHQENTAFFITLSLNSDKIRDCERSRVTARSLRSQHETKQLSLFAESEIPKKPAKPQIASSPGVCIKRRDRYRVVLGAEVLGDGLTIDKALQLVKGGKK